MKLALIASLLFAVHMYGQSSIGKCSEDSFTATVRGELEDKEATEANWCTGWLSRRLDRQFGIPFFFHRVLHGCQMLFCCADS